MTITTIQLPADFGNDGPRDALFVRSILSYNDGRLFWIVSPGFSIRSGSEAGGVSEKGYRKVRIGGKKFRSHRLVWLMKHDSWPNEEIDHINGDRLDNRIENLRDVSRHENQKNTKRFENNKSGFTGIYWVAKNSVWRASISEGKKLVHLGHFKCLAQAVRVRKEAERRNNYHANHGRSFDSPKQIATASSSVLATPDLPPIFLTAARNSG